MKAHLYCEMLPYHRQALTPEELLDVKLQSTFRKFKSKEEMKEFLIEKPLKTNEGYYTAENKIVHGKQGYASVYYYDKEELDDHLTRHDGSIAGFTGKCYSDWLYFDLESKEGSSEMGKRVRPFIQYLEERSIPYVNFFSGNQGFHLYVPMSVLKVPAEYKDKAHIVAKIYAKMIAKQFPEMADVIDPQVYGINTTLRMPFTINPKSGLIKTVLLYKDNKFERIKNSLEMFNAIAKTLWNRNTELSEQAFHWELDESYMNISEPSETKFETYFPAPYGEKVCPYNLMNAHIGKGDHRHEAGLRLMGWMKHDKQWPDTYVWAFLKEWNKSLADPRTEGELKNVYKYIDSINYNLCNDPFMEKYCPGTNVCPYWKIKMEGLLAVTARDILKKIKEDSIANYPTIDFAQVYEGTRLIATPAEGQIAFVIGGSKAGKTTYAINAAVRLKKPTVMISYEMGRTGLMRIFGKILGLDPLNPIDVPELEAQTRHIIIIDEGRVALQMIPQEIATIERTHNIKIEMVILDYLQLIPVYDINRAGRFITNSVEKMDTMAALLPEMVKKHGWFVLIPAQPTQAVEGGGSTMLMPNSGKGGQAIQAMADFIITIWRPYKNDDPLVYNDNDNVFSAYVGMNRWDREDIVRNFNYYGDRRLIEGIYTGDVKQKPVINPAARS